LTREVVFGAGKTGFGWEIPLMRTREVEIHHVDVDAGYMPVGRLSASDADRSWEVAADGPTLTGPTNALLAWLTGRSSGDGLQLDTGDAVPVAPTWR
jgi:maleylpyruvate isomerase